MQRTMSQLLTAGVIMAFALPAYAGGASQPAHAGSHGGGHYAYSGHGYGHYHGYRYYGVWPYGYYVADYGPPVLVGDVDNGNPPPAAYENEEPPPQLARVVQPVSMAAVAAPAAIQIRTTPTARVWFDGTATTQTGTVRTFSTPPLEPGKTYSYKVRACWLEDGRPTVRTRTVEVASGGTAEVDLR
jgi:uncharacterized protein (TIGR03000 family)